MKLCILGCGRSGTSYTASMLNSAGLRIGHEYPGQDGSVGGIFWKKTRRNLLDYDVIWHQVRNPIHTIASLTTLKPASFTEYMFELGSPRCAMPQSSLCRAMLVWLMYTEWADRYATYTYQVEDFDRVFPRIMALYGKHCQPIQSISKKLNTRPHATVRFRHLMRAHPTMAELVRFRGIKYGYWGR